ncbi:ribosomal protein RPS6, partial [Cardiosporidium cionae]
IVGPDLSVLNLVLKKQGPSEIPGLTDGDRPRRLGPKRASRIRKLFNLPNLLPSNASDMSTEERKKAQGIMRAQICKNVVRRKIEGKNKSKAPKIQRLVTDRRLSRKIKLRNVKLQQVKETRQAAKEYAVLLSVYRKEKKSSLKATAALAE